EGAQPRQKNLPHVLGAVVRGVVALARMERQNERARLSRIVIVGNGLAVEDSGTVRGLKCPLLKARRKRLQQRGEQSDNDECFHLKISSEASLARPSCCFGFRRLDVLLQYSEKLRQPCRVSGPRGSGHQVLMDHSFSDGDIDPAGSGQFDFRTARRVPGTALSAKNAGR